MEKSVEIQTIDRRFIIQRGFIKGPIRYCLSILSGHIIMVIMVLLWQVNNLYSIDILNMIIIILPSGYVITHDSFMVRHHDFRP